MVTTQTLSYIYITKYSLTNHRPNDITELTFCKKPLYCSDKLSSRNVLVDMCKVKEAIIFKSSFDESSTSADPYIEKLKELHINCHPIKALDFEFCNITELNDKLQKHDQYEGN